jgi:hypothetical protein
VRAVISGIGGDWLCFALEYGVKLRDVRFLSADTRVCLG